MEESARYNAAIMDHFLNPRNVGDLPDANAVGEVGRVAFGDVMRISLRIRNGTIEEARFRTFGCGTAIATSSIATELLKGRTIEEALNFGSREVVEALGGLPAAKIHCSVMVAEAVKAALANYEQRRRHTPEGPPDAP